MQQQQGNRQRTVEELLEMITGGKGTRSSSASISRPPPPVPPKPRSIIESSCSNIMGEERVGFSGFRRYFPSKTNTYSPIEEANKNTGFNFNGKYDAYIDDMKVEHDRKRGADGLYTAGTTAATVAAMQAKMMPLVDQFDKTNADSQSQLLSGILEPEHEQEKHHHHLWDLQPQQQPKPQQPKLQQQQLKQDFNRTEANCSTHELTTTSPTPSQPSPMTDNHHHAIKQPVVTESSEEANNDNNIRKSIYRCSDDNSNNNNNRTFNASTVKISELTSSPLSRQKVNYAAHGNQCTISPTFSRSKRQQQQLFYGNNSYAAPVITTLATDDEDGDQSDKDVVELLPIEMENALLKNNNNNNNESASNDQQPPRTSTPNNTQSQFDDPISSSTTISAPTITDSRNRVIVHVSKQNIQFDDYVCEVDEYDPSNTSRDTDELILNQSGGGELIGIIENSDSAANSRDCTMNEPNTSKVPYTVQEFNETLRSNSISPPESSRKQIEAPEQHENSYHHQNHHQQEPHSPCQERIRELEEMTNSLLNKVDKLNDHVLTLTSKIDDLELQVDKQEKSITNMNYQCEGSFFHNNSNSNIPNQSLSKSTSTINRLSSGMGRQGNGSSSTYLRNSVAKIFRNPRASTVYSSVGSELMSTSMQNYSTTSRLQSLLSQSCHNTVTKSLNNKPVAHASTSSLYATESHKQAANESISPTNYSHHQSSSPTSILSLTARRDPKPYTSMLSLNSLGQHSVGSTLKKASAISDSVSNVSHISSQLSNWPSMSDFVANKHRAKDVIYSEEENLIRMVLYNTLINLRVPSWMQSNYNIHKVIEQPPVRLKLDWVYGYRGRDCRSNIYYLPTNECVYFVASIVVLYNVEEQTQRHYLGHTDSVKCLAVHPSKLIIASGQSSGANRRDKRPIVRVWNTVSLATLRVIGFNEDFDRAICCLAFSKHDMGATLVVVDESNEHTITILDWEREKNWRIAETNSGHELVLAIDFHPIDKYSLVAIGKSSINFWDIRGMTLTKKAGLFDKYDKPKYVLCQTFNDFGETITGDTNGNIMIWPRGANRPQRVIHNAHQGGVFSILAMKDGSYLSGGRDRRIVEWDDKFNRTGRKAELPEHCGGVRFITYARGSQVLVGTVRNSILLGSLDDNFSLIMQGHTEATSCLAIQPNQAQYLTGGFDEQIHLFDVATHSIEWSKCLTMPATAASFSPNGYLLVGSTLGKWLVIDALSQEILFTKCDGSGTINCIKFSPDGQFFSMGSSDSQIYVYQTTEAGNKFRRVGTCVGHSGPVKEMDWSDDSRYIQSQSMNFELLHWKASNCRPLDDENIVGDLVWHTHNCTLGFNVIGIWSDSIDSALVSYCDKSNNDDLMVSSSDTGNINIFKWPPCYNQCLSQKYHGNVEKFNFIKFLPDDSRLIAVGSKNCVTTEWIVDKESL